MKNINWFGRHYISEMDYKNLTNTLKTFGGTIEGMHGLLHNAHIEPTVTNVEYIEGQFGYICDLYDRIKSIVEDI